VAWRRRLIIALWGLLAVQVYVAVKIVLLSVAYTARGGGSLAQALQSLLWVLSATTLGWALVPALIWLALTLAHPSARRALTSRDIAG
jgi:hypothetical protein